jgi:hypothetical protein
MIITKNYCYTDYYVPSSTPGSNSKVNLKHNEKMSNFVKKGNIIKFHQYDSQQYVIIDEGLGVFSVETFDEI